MKTALPVLLLLLCAGRTVSAAEMPRLPAPGDRVRVTGDADHARYTAEVVEALPGWLLVRAQPGAAPRRLDLTCLRRLEVSRGHRNYASAGAIAAFVPGFALGALTGALSCFEQTNCGAVGTALALGTLAGTDPSGAERRPPSACASRSRRAATVRRAPRFG